jgi:endonuclease YncB( thermonuclease family)
MTTHVRAAVAALVVGVAGTILAPATAAAPQASATGTKWASVLRWGDGDTVDTSRGKVRLIGIDTPELGRCGAAVAHQRAEKLAPPGSKIRLVDPRSVRNEDKYGRLLRYVEIAGKDIGLAQIKNGARARYDSRTGYDHHPRQVKYIRADKKHNPPCAPAPSDGSESPRVSWRLGYLEPAPVGTGVST